MGFEICTQNMSASEAFLEKMSNEELLIIVAHLMHVGLMQQLSACGIGINAEYLELSVGDSWLLASASATD